MDRDYRSIADEIYENYSHHGKGRHRRGTGLAIFLAFGLLVAVVGIIATTASPQVQTPPPQVELWSVSSLILEGVVQSPHWLTVSGEPEMSEFPMELELTCPAEGLIDFNISSSATTVNLVTRGASESQLAILPSELGLGPRLVIACTAGETFTLRW